MDPSPINMFELFLLAHHRIATLPPLIICALAYNMTTAYLALELLEQCKGHTERVVLRYYHGEHCLPRAAHIRKAGHADLISLQAELPNQRLAVTFSKRDVLYISLRLWWCDGPVAREVEVGLRVTRGLAVVDGALVRAELGAVLLTKHH